MTDSFSPMISIICDHVHKRRGRGFLFKYKYCTVIYCFLNAVDILHFSGIIIFTKSNITYFTATVR